MTIPRPLAAVLLLACLLMVAVVAIGASWVDLSAVDEERDAKADLLERSVAASRRVKPATAAVRDPFVGAESATLAAAGLDALVRADAVQAGCDLLSSRAEVKPDEAATPGRIEVQAVVEGGNDALQALLLRLEGGAPMVLVDELAIEPAEAPAGTAANLQAPRLRMNLTLSGFWKAARS